MSLGSGTLSAVGVVLLVVMAAEGQDVLFQRSPRDGDSCTTFRLSSDVPSIARLMGSRLLALPCNDGLVVNSAGQCVSPEDSDRCQHGVVFNPQIQCSRQPDKVFADPFSCANYYDCRQGGAHSMGCPVGLLYNDIKKECAVFTEVECGERAVDYSSQQLSLICQLNPNRILPRTDICNGYYNCSANNGNTQGRSFLPAYHAECPYLSLLDVETKTCQPYEGVRCNDRRELKNPCDLQHLQCPVAHCRPCSIVQPDCTSLGDGKQVFLGQEFTPKYANCLQGRTLGSGRCVSADPSDTSLFDARRGDCFSARSIPRSLGGAGPEE